MRWWAVIALVAGCGGGKGEVEEGAPDADGDGWTADEDCDDADPAVHPEAEERCNGVDDDCDGATDLEDPDLADWPTWYADSDGDGYGDEDYTAHGCERPEGTSRQGGDCDDRDPDVHPDATEVCNGVDDDCDGLVDDEDDDLRGAPTYYPDEDGDGTGPDEAGEPWCDPPSGWVADGGDCDDADPAVHPGAEETCGDGTDSDCDGGDGAASGLADEALACAQARVEPDGAAAAGIALAAGDLDGDFRAELVVGSEAGLAWVVDGEWAAAGGAVDPLAAVGDGDAAGLAGRAAAVADVDHDGVDDLLLGAAGGDGGVWLVYGPVTDDRAVPDLGPIAGDLSGGGAGTALAAGDFDSDGRVELLVGAPGSGGVRLVGDAGDPPARLSAADAALDVPGSGLGAAVALLGDIDGDGVADAAAGAPEGGAVYLLMGPATGGRFADAVAMAVAPGSEAGAALAAVADLDGDGYEDLLVGAPGWAEGAGAVAFLAGPVTATRPLDELPRAEGVAAGDRLGAALSARSGAWLAGAPGSGDGAGAAWLAEGPLTGVVRIDEVAEGAEGKAAGDAAGSSVLLPGDLDGDAVSDWAEGEPGALGGAGRARVVLLPGG